MRDLLKIVVTAALCVLTYEITTYLTATFAVRLEHSHTREELPRIRKRFHCQREKRVRLQICVGRKVARLFVCSPH